MTSGANRPYSREEFKAVRAAAKGVEGREGRILAVVSVGFGLGQLFFLRWSESHLERGLRLSLAGVVFLAYLALVGLLVWRLKSRTRAAKPLCPACGRRLEGLSERVASATGRCDACGGEVLAAEPPLNVPS